MFRFIILVLIKKKLNLKLKIKIYKKFAIELLENKLQPIGKQKQL